ncbi:hypothetical protein [Vibrio sp. 10N.261.46.A3]|uniref:hypothetical protein n=1 Tax=Vibrio sp. 10N.261.46.A3 TaxID=3229658 RepID=UPI00354E6D10
MLRLSLMRPTLLSVVCSGVIFPAIAAQSYVHGAYGFGEESTSQWGVGGGVNFDDSPWGGEFNVHSSSSTDIGRYTVSQSWVALSATYRIRHFFLDKMTLKGGVGVSSIYQGAADSSYQNNNFLWNVTSNVDLSYQVNRYLDIFGGYRFFVGDSFESLSPNAWMFGARLYWSRPEPAVTLLNDENITPALADLRADTFSQSAQLEQKLDEYGLSQSFSQFVIQSDATSEVDWQRLTLIVDEKDVTLDVQLTEQVGQLRDRLPKGEHTLHFTLVGVSRKTGDMRQVESSYSIVLYHSQGLNFLLSIKPHLLGEALHVQAF